LRLLLDEMYPRTLADALNGGDLEVVMVAELGLAGSSDAAVLEASVIGGYAVLTDGGAGRDRTCDRGIMSPLL
jgi:predicted nuclease of predicted toxin-antitoxin system